MIHPTRCGNCGSHTVFPSEHQSTTHFDCANCNMHFQRCIIQDDGEFIYHQDIMKPRGMWTNGGNPTTVRVTFVPMGIFAEWTDKSAHKAKKKAEDLLLDNLEMLWNIKERNKKEGGGEE